MLVEVLGYGRVRERAACPAIFKRGRDCVHSRVSSVSNIIGDLLYTGSRWADGCTLNYIDSACHLVDTSRRKQWLKAECALDVDAHF